MTRIALLLALGGFLPALAIAQEQQEKDTPAPKQETGQVLTPETLPVSLERVRRQLVRAESSSDEGLRLQYYVEVFGRAPRFDLLAGVDLQHGPVPYGAPTHADFLHLVTPQEFRSPPADLTSITMALMKWLNRDRDRKERER
jgi:hypothetical protein